MELDSKSKYLRSLVIKAIKNERRGHIGPAMSLIEILRCVYESAAKHRPDDPDWSERDVVILSKGHGCLALYAVLAERGFFELSELEKFGDPNSILGGHPERDKIPGVEASTGALGHGLSIGVGIAKAIKIKKSARAVFIIVGDGEINEGSVWEAAMSAAKHQLSNLTLLVDYNKLQSYGEVSEVMPLEPLKLKLQSFGFAVKEINGHDVNEINEHLKLLPLEQTKPSALICHTVKGKGIPKAENNPLWHHRSNLTETDITELENLFLGA